MSTPVTIPEIVAEVEMPAAAAELELQQAAQIVQAFREAQESAASTIRKVIRCGFLLLAQKAAMPHGDFLGWLTERCPSVPTRTAQQWMHLSKAAAGLIDCKPDQRFDGLPMYRLLELPGEELKPLARKAQARLLEALDGKSQKQIIFDWRNVGGSGGGERKPMTADEKRQAEKQTASEMIKGWLHATAVMVDSGALLKCGDAELLDRVGDAHLELGTVLKEIEEGNR